MRTNKKILWIIIFCFVGSFIVDIKVDAVDRFFDQNNDIQFYDEFGSISSTSCTVLAPIVNNREKLIKTIDDYIKEKAGTSSPYYGLGVNFVDGALASNINPFIAVATAQHESSFGTATNKNWFSWVFKTKEAAEAADETQKTESYNGFGRSASDSQPHAWYPGKNGARRVYKWSSWKDSLIGNDNFFAYYKRLWVDEKGYKCLDQIIPEYAPKTDGNNPSGYLNFMNKVIQDLISRAGDSVLFNLVSENGMSLEQARRLVSIYKFSSDSKNYLGGADRTCSGGPLANCVSFSTYFINKYTSLSGFDNTSGDGWAVAKNVGIRNSDVVVDHTPSVYSVFSHHKSTRSPDGHTGIVLGIDRANNKIIIGEAGCGYSFDWIDGKEKNLSDFTSGDYDFAHINSYLKTSLLDRDV